MIQNIFVQSGNKNTITSALETPLREQDYVLRALRAFIAGESKPHFPDNINWNYFERIAARNGLLAIFQSLLGANVIPTERLEKWQRVSIQTWFNYSQALKATTQLFQALEAEAIPAVVMRGMALTQSVYNDPVLRPMTDVDVLVSSSSRHHLVEKLEKHGLKPARVLRSQFVYEIEHTKFEVHWSFLTPKRYRDVADFDQWLHTRRQLLTEQGPMYCLSPENELLELVCHAFIHHELDTLLKLIDIALVARQPNLDWDYIAHWCRQAGMSRQFMITLGLIDALFALPLLQQFPGKRALPRHAERYFRAYANRYFQIDSLSSVYRRKQALLYVAENPAVKIKQFLRFVSKDQLSEIFKSAKSGRRVSAARAYPFRAPS